MEGLMNERLKLFTDPASRVGATYVEGEGVYIRIWALYAKNVEIEWVGSVPERLKKEDRGYHTGFYPSKKAGDRYFFIIDGKRFPDPASRYQPDGIFGPSQVTTPEFEWSSASPAAPFSEWVIYEIHTGAFSDRHDFTGIVEDLPRLKSLGITAIEIMPVSPFPGTRNWGYDGVFPHAVHDSYGGPYKLKELIDVCHTQGIAVILDVVYNHLGPEGNVLFDCAPYAQDRYKSPWGKALNYDGEYSEEVRRYFLQTVWQWFTEFRFDGLRLDAIQTIFDTAPLSFLQEVNLLKREAEKVRGCHLITIAETDANDVRTLMPIGQGGMGFDAQWADDLHHSIHALLTGENEGYYADYGTSGQLEKIYRHGVAYNGNYSSFHKRRHGSSYQHIDKKSLIVETQNHDQIGNRMKGERLSTLISFEELKLAAAMIFLSPFTPFMFMGEEFASEKPFLFFVDHQDQELLQAVRQNRKEEWKDFEWSEDPPDPADPETFRQCVLDQKTFPPSSKENLMVNYYRMLISLSKRVRGMALRNVERKDNIIVLHYEKGGKGLRVHFLLGAEEVRIPVEKGQELIFHSGEYGQAAQSIYHESFYDHGILTLPSYTAAVIYG